jgi:hypothetical protein
MQQTRKLGSCYQRATDSITQTQICYTAPSLLSRVLAATPILTPRRQRKLIEAYFQESFWINLEHRRTLQTVVFQAIRP